MIRTNPGDDRRKTAETEKLDKIEADVFDTCQLPDSLLHLSTTDPFLRSIEEWVTSKKETFAKHGLSFEMGHSPEDCNRPSVNIVLQSHSEKIGASLSIWHDGRAHALIVGEDANGNRIPDEEFFLDLQKNSPTFSIDEALLPITSRLKSLSSTSERRNDCTEPKESLRKVTIAYGDITKINAEAIVTSANGALSGGGGVDGAIHRAAGPELAKHGRETRNAKVGQALLSPGFNLDAKYVIHAVSPVWQGGTKDEESLLKSCVQNALDLTIEKNIASLAIPALAMGAYRFPPEKAADVIVGAVLDWMKHHESHLQVILVGNEKKIIRAFEKAVQKNKAKLP
ncbi:MAG: macro domain-containing protein [Bdellovibrionales bacterium]|nr:macro domain-containing protein [Bdellovibrionales bacterium]